MRRFLGIKFENKELSSYTQMQKFMQIQLS